MQPANNEHDKWGKLNKEFDEDMGIANSNVVDENNYPLFDGLIGLNQKPMKTAMQEAIEIIEERLKILSIVQRTESTMGAIAGYQYSKYLLMDLLEKEKEQIIDFAYGCTQHISREEIEEYFNKEFKNQ